MKLIRTTARSQLLKRLAAARQRSGLTQEQLSEKLATRPRWVAKYESGERSLGALGKRSTRNP
jgi:transcriptional regulator with XRE-family HTH domain